MPPLASFIDSATNPLALGFLAAGLLASVAIAGYPFARDLWRSTAQRARAAATGAAAIAREPRRSTEVVKQAAGLPRWTLVYGVLGLALFGWAMWAFTRPTTDPQTAQRARFEHAMSIGYVARGAPSTLLPDGMMSPVTAETVQRTGSQPPLYSGVLSKIDFGINYEMTSQEPLSVLGSGGAAVRIKAQDGWERTIPLLPAQFLSGPKVTMLTTLDLDALRMVIAGVELETGSKSEWYDLTLIPVIRLAGELGGERIDETYAPEFRWRYDRARITPDAALIHREKHTRRVTLDVPAHVSAFGLSLRMSFARWAALAGAVVALAGAASLAVPPPKPSREAVNEQPAPPPVRAVAPPAPPASRAPPAPPDDAAVPITVTGDEARAS